MDTHRYINDVEIHVARAHQAAPIMPLLEESGVLARHCLKRQHGLCFRWRPFWISASVSLTTFSSSSYLFLFIDFYFRTYKKSQQQKGKAAANGKANGSANG